MMMGDGACSTGGYRSFLIAILHASNHDLLLERRVYLALNVHQPQTTLVVFLLSPDRDAGLSN